MKVDEKRLLDKIIELATPLMLEENESLELTRKNATAIVSLCEVMIDSEQVITKSYRGSEPYPDMMPQLHRESVHNDIGFKKAAQEQHIGK